jgi:arylsulfatase A-like enzyme
MMVSRRFSALLLLFSALAACRPSPPTVPPTRPNVLLLVIDCLRSDHLSSHGYHRPTTPTLDRLAAEGTSFTRAYSQASWTRPSLPTILSGLYPSEHGLLGFEQDESTVSSAVVAAEVELVSESLQQLGWATALIGEQYQLSPRFGLEQGFDLYRYKTSGAPNIHRRFFEWLDGQTDPQRPWFAYLHYLEIHWPYCPPETTRGRFDPGKSSIDFCFQWRKLRDDIHSGAVVLGPDDIETMRARYDEELLALDQRIAEMLTELANRGALDNTMIVVTSDHGEEFMERGGIGHGQSLHEELTAVPLIVRPPTTWEAPRGRQLGHLVETRNIKSTLVHAAGGPVVPGVAPSLLPAALGWTEEPVQLIAVSESTDDVAIRNAEWTLITRRDGASAALYERATDPAERVDLARERRRELAAMRELSATWQASLRPVRAGEGQTELDPETEAALRALGYLGGGDGSAPAPTPPGESEEAP